MPDTDQPNSAHGREPNHVSLPPPVIGSGGRGRRTRRVATIGLIGAVASAALAVPALAGTDVHPVAREHNSDADGAADVDLGELTLDELADELARLGLQVSIEPDFESDAGDSGGVDDLWPDEEDGEWSDDEEPVASFTVDGDQLDGASTVDPAVADQAREIWGRFVELIPADQRTMVVGFELMDEDYAGAHVYPSDDDPTTWILGVAPMADRAELDYVLIHEFAHLLTLNASQVPADPEGDDACEIFHTGEGCALSDSTIGEFVERFWPEDRLAEVERLMDSDDFDAFDEFYEQYKDEFVTDYAANHPAEDLAEVFTYFVLNDRPTGSTVADQKVQLLWDDPSMVALRDRIRGNVELS